MNTKIRREDIPIGFLAFYQDVCPKAYTLGVDVERYTRAYMDAMEKGDHKAAIQALQDMANDADRLKKSSAPAKDRPEPIHPLEQAFQKAAEAAGHFRDVAIAFSGAHEASPASPPLSPDKVKKMFQTHGHAINRHLAHAHNALKRIKK